MFMTKSVATQSHLPLETSPDNIANSSFATLLESYIRYYADGVGHTARAKRLDLDHFSKFLMRYVGVSKVEKLKVTDWSTSSTQAFVEEKLRSGESPTTVARRLATLKHLGRTLSEKLIGFTNPAREVKTPKMSIVRPKGIDPRELEQVKNVADHRLAEKDNFIRHRNEFLLKFLLDTGLRAEEVRLLKINQIDEKFEWIKNVRTKGKKYRNVYITSEIRPSLIEYLEKRQLELTRFFSKLSKSIDKTLPLFISTYGAKINNAESFLMGAKTIWRAINELSNQTKLHPHLLRHCYALDLLNSSNDIRLVAQALGHGDVRITMRYTERTEEQVAEALEKSRKTKS